MSNLKNLFGKRLKLLRKSKGISQEIFAEMININPRNLSRIETGQTFPTTENLEKIINSLECAKKSGIFDCVFVSTDSEKYAEISRQYGASVPFLRSSENSSDKAGSWDVVKEVLSKLDDKYDIVALLQHKSDSIKKMRAL